MADSRLFQKVDGVTTEKIGRSVENMLRGKGMTVQGGKAGQGYVVQAKDADSWKTISGMSAALEVQISDAGNGILVNIGSAKWSDKVGAGVLGMFVFAPLAVTAVMGSVKQKKLPEEVFAHIERFVASGGRDMFLGTDFANASAGNGICPHCGSENLVGQAFCSSCGKALTIECSGCGRAVPFGTAYCPHCGSKPDAPQTVVCVKCGKVNAADSSFCSGCGEKLQTVQEKHLCSGCGAEIAADSVFCPKCGNKL